MAQAAVAPVSLPSYQRPRGLDEALALLRADPTLQVVCGGTDWYAARVGRPVGSPMLDISAIKDLRTIEVTDHTIRIGAGARWADLRCQPLPLFLAALVQAAQDVGGWQVQYRASLGGNLCNASPAADGVVPLLALDAEVELQHAEGLRRLSLGDFIKAPRTTARLPHELLTTIIVPRDERMCSTFYKLGSRAYLVISLVMLTVVIRMDREHVLDHCAIAVGACSPVAMRLPELERAIVGQHASQVMRWLQDHLVDPHWLSRLRPIDDVRATAAYRLDAVKVGLIRSFEALLLV